MIERVEERQKQRSQYSLIETCAQEGPWERDEGLAFDCERGFLDWETTRVVTQ
jgi:hypothetical protein